MNYLPADDEIMDDESTTNETTNICTFCNFLSINKSGLVEHHNQKHRDKPPPLFKCDHCQFSHKKNKNVREHSEKVHRKKFFAYKCQTCNKQMMKFVSYRNHVKTACKTNSRKEQKYVLITCCHESWFFYFQLFSREKIGYFCKTNNILAFSNLF